MGFRDRHVAEAMQYCNDQASALDWLCRFLSSFDLPHFHRGIVIYDIHVIDG